MRHVQRAGMFHMILVWVAILWIIPILVGHSIGKAKGRAGLLYGLFLGWLGVIIVFMLPPLKTAKAPPPEGSGAAKQ